MSFVNVTAICYCLSSILEIYIAYNNKEADRAWSV